jgi:hypothetical protein
MDENLPRLSPLDTALFSNAFPAMVCENAVHPHPQRPGGTP